LVLPSCPFLEGGAYSSTPSAYCPAGRFELPCYRGSLPGSEWSPGTLLGPATGSHIVNRGTPVAPLGQPQLNDPGNKSHPRKRPLQPRFPNEPHHRRTADDSLTAKTPQGGNIIRLEIERVKGERGRTFDATQRRQSAPKGLMHSRSWLGSSADPAGYAGYATVWRQHGQQATGNTDTLLTVCRSFDHVFRQGTEGAVPYRHSS